MTYWNLNENEYRLAEAIYETERKVYIDANGNLCETIKGLGEVIDSSKYDTFHEFKDEIENAKIRVEEELMSQ